MVVVREAVRGILLTDDRQLLLMRRVKPGQEPYWTTPGGGVERSDISLEAALRREVSEELGSELGPCHRIFLVTDDVPGGVRLQHFFCARVKSYDFARRYGSEFLRDDRGEYGVDRYAVRDSAALAGLALKPAAVKQFILDNGEGILALIDL